MRNREVLNLSMVSGPVLLKIKANSCIFTFSGFKQTKKQRKNNEQNDEIGQMLVSGAIDDSKTIGKTAADIFAKSGLEKP